MSDQQFSRITGREIMHSYEPAGFDARYSSINDIAAAVRRAYVLLQDQSPQSIAGTATGAIGTFGL